MTNIDSRGPTANNQEYEATLSIRLATYDSSDDAMTNFQRGLLPSVVEALRQRYSAAGVYTSKKKSSVDVIIVRLRPHPLVDSFVQTTFARSQ